MGHRRVPKKTVPARDRAGRAPSLLSSPISDGVKIRKVRQFVGSLFCSLAKLQ